MSELRYKSIGIVHSPFKRPKNVPIQPVTSKGIKGSVEFAREYVEGLKSLEGFSHISNLSLSLVKILFFVCKTMLG